MPGEQAVKKLCEKYGSEALSQNNLGPEKKIVLEII